MIKLKLLFFLVLMCGSISSNGERDKEFQMIESTLTKYIKGTAYYKYTKKNNKKIFFRIDEISKDSISRMSSVDWNKELNDGVYHFYIPDIRYSYDHILIKKNNTYKIFESITCVGNINSVKTYIKKYYINNSAIIENIENIRAKSEYLKIDAQSMFRCNDR